MNGHQVEEVDQAQVKRCPQGLHLAYRLHTDLLLPTPTGDPALRRKADRASTKAGMPKTGGRSAIDIPVNKGGRIPEKVMIAGSSMRKREAAGLKGQSGLASAISWWTMQLPRTPTSRVPRRLLNGIGGPTNTTSRR